jgi:hypothetical protein
MEEGNDRGICKTMVWLLRVVVTARPLRSEDKKVQHRAVRNRADVSMAGLPDGKTVQTTGAGSVCLSRIIIPRTDNRENDRWDN